MKAIRNSNVIIFFIIAISMLMGCQQGGDQGSTITKGEVKLITLDPSHFHAALVQKRLLRYCSEWLSFNFLN